jgi:hypothetical protein
MLGTHATRRIARRTGAAVGLTAALAVLPQAHAATNLFNLYVGAAYARSNLRARDLNPIPFSNGGPLNSFDRSDSGYQLTLGARGLDLLGAEVDYFDLGSGSVSNGYGLPTAGTISGASLSQKGEAAFAMLYLPVPVIDIYLKTGSPRTSAPSSRRKVSAAPPESWAAARASHLRCTRPLPGLHSAPARNGNSAIGECGPNTSGSPPTADTPTWYRSAFSGRSSDPDGFSPARASGYDELLGSRVLNGAA